MNNRKGLNLYCGTDQVVIMGTLYDTNIFKRHNDNIIVLNSGGFKTNHTKNCMNDLLPDGYKVVQEKSVWYVITPNEKLEYKDNMKIKVEV